MKIKHCLNIVALALFIPGALYANASPLEGKWYTTKPEKNAVIEIAKCTAGGETFCGTMVELQTPNYPDGTPKTDKNNKDEKLRARPLLGMQLLTGFKKDGEKSWTDGKIYNPEDGDIYSCEMNLENKDGKELLQVRGYVGLPIFGKTQTWVRLKDGENAPWSKKEDDGPAKEHKTNTGFLDSRSR
jgi:uncharacterized protein (DUF2147 family)